MHPSVAAARRAFLVRQMREKNVYPHKKPDVTTQKPAFPSSSCFTGYFFAKSKFRIFNAGFSENWPFWGKSVENPIHF